MRTNLAGASALETGSFWFEPVQTQSAEFALVTSGNLQQRSIYFLIWLMSRLNGTAISHSAP